MIEMPSYVAEAAEQGDKQVVREWVDEDPANLWAIDAENNHETLLHKAARGGHRSIVKYLIKAGLPTEVSEDSGFTPLLEATNDGHVEVVKYLIGHGADANARDNDGKSALDMAMEDGHKELIEFLKKDSVRWTMTSDTEVTRRTCKPSLRYTLTEVFNFEAQTYLLVASNAVSKSESCQISSFDDLRRTSLVQQAEEAFRHLGGKLPGEYVPATLEKYAPKLSLKPAKSGK